MYTPFTADEDYDAKRVDAFFNTQPVPRELEEGLPEAQPVEESQPQQQTEQPQEDTTAQPEQQTYADIQQEKEQARDFDASNPMDYLEAGASIPAGLVDFSIDAANNIFDFTPWDKTDQLIPPLPRSQTKLANGIRDVAAVVLPTIAATVAATRGGGAARGAISNKIGNAAVSQPKLRALARVGEDGFFKWFTNVGLGAGAGAWVDSVSTVQGEDANLQRSLRDLTEAIRGQKMGDDEPTLWFFPADWATKDTDSPDIIRAKNRNEGIGMGVLSDMIGGVAKFIKARRGIEAGVQYLPENEIAENYFKNKTTDQLAGETLSDNPIEDIIYKQVAERDRQLDELGQYRMSTIDGDIDQPLKGVHKDFDPLENGVRSADPDGVVGAAVDATRIKYNQGTFSGRIRSVMTEAAKKYGIEATSLSKRNLVKAVADKIKESGHYGYRVGKFKMTWKQIHEAGTELMEYIMDPLADTKFIAATLKEFSNTIDDELILNDVGYDAASRAMKAYMKEYLDMDELKASAYLQTSFAGEVSDLAGSAERLKGSVAVAAAREQIFDRLKFLMVETGISKFQRGYSLANANWWKRLQYIKDPAAISDQVKIAEREYGKRLTQLIEEAEQMRLTMENVQRERPELLDPWMKAFDYTDGDVNSIAKLNAYMKESFGGVRKYLIDQHPDTPSVWVQTIFSLQFNSVLSAFATPVKALVGNAGGLLERPAQHLIGAAMAGDIKNIRKGMYMYGSLIDSLQVALPHAWKTFKKASIDPDSVSYIAREDYAARNAETLEVMESYAKAEKAAGNAGPEEYLEVVKPMIELSKSPVSRFGTNAMTAFDALTKGLVASAEAKREIWENALPSLRKDKKSMNSMARRLLKEKYFEGDMIKESYVDYVSGEIALNLGDGSMLGELTKYFPPVRNFIMFPKTTENVLQAFANRSPVGILNYDMINYGWLKPHQISDEVIQKYFKQHGIQSINPAKDYQRFVNEIQLLRGRVAMSTAITTAAAGYILFGNVRGNGHTNKPVEKTRKQLEDYKPRTLKVPGTKDTWVSGEFLGPIGDWLFLYADIQEAIAAKNIDPNTNLISNMMYVLAANFANRSILSGMEPLLDVMSGNPSAFARWAANFTSAQAPMSSQRAELGRLFLPQLRVVEEEFFAQLKNRNNIGDIIDPDGALPLDYDWIDGGAINDGGNLLTRLINVYTPFKLNGGLSKRKQFLLDYEFDGRPQYSTGVGGVKFTPEEQSLLANIIGEKDLFGQELDIIIRDAENWEYGKGVTKENFDNYMNIQNRLHTALSRSIMAARNDYKFQEQFSEGLLQREFEQSENELSDRRGLPRMYH